MSSVKKPGTYEKQLHLKKRYHRSPIFIPCLFGAAYRSCLPLHAMQGLDLGRLHARCCRCYCLAVMLASAMCCAFTPCFTPTQGRCCSARAPLAHAAAQPYVHRRARLLRCSAEPPGAAVASAQASLQLQPFSDESTSPGSAQTTASRSKYNKRRRARSKRLAAAAASPDHEVAPQSTQQQQQQQQQQTLQATRDARVSELAAPSAAAAPQADAPRGSRTKHALSPLQQNSTTTISSSNNRVGSAASSGKKQIRTRTFEPRSKGSSSRPRRSTNNSTSSSITSSSSSSSDSTSILGSRAKDTSSSSSSSSLKELENSFERVIRALSKPVTAAALQASLDGTSSTAAASSNAATLAEAAKKKVETTMDAAARAASKRSRRKSSSTTASTTSSKSSSSSMNASVGDASTVKTGSNSATVTDSSSGSSSSGSLSSNRSSTVGGITSTGRIEPPLRVDPPQRYVEVIYNRRARDVFTWITTNSESFGTVLSHDQASRMNKRSRISWLLQVSEVQLATECQHCTQHYSRQEIQHSVAI
jgi:hypothetical protein